MTLEVPCWNPQQAAQAVKETIWPHIREKLQSGKRVTVIVRQEKRSGQENRLLHALLGEIAASIEWAGKKRDIETWKRLLTAAWCRARNEHIEFLPAIDGNGVDIVFRRTSDLTKGEAAELIEYIYAWGAQAGVKFSAYESD